MNERWRKLLRPRAWYGKALLILFVVCVFSVGTLGYFQPVRAFLESEPLTFIVGESRFTAYLLAKAALTIVILYWLAGYFSEFGEKRIRKFEGIAAGNKAIVTKAFQILVYFIAFIIGLDILEVDLTTLAIFSGAIGIGVGIGLQKIASNFISGFILLFEKSVEEGDLVELSDGTYGLIRDTGARYTLIETFDGKEIMIPNEDFITNRVTNWTFSNNKGRIEIGIGVSYESDIEKAMELILEAAREHPRCAEDPEPACFLREFADSSVNFTLFFWITDVTEGRYEPQSDVMRSIWRKFKDNGIQIPFPQRDLHIKNPEALG